MPDPVDAAAKALETQLAAVRKQLAGYDDLKAQEQKLEAALASLRGNPPGAASRGKNRKRAPRGSRPLEMLAALERLGPARLTDLARELGIRPQQASSLLKDLDVHKDADGLYRIGKKR